jgi:hypothetical protein
MSAERKSFVELALEGKVLLDEIDDFVASWHGGSETEPLRRFLGMDKDEYSLWLREPSALPYIIKARHDQLPLLKVVNDNYEQSRLAARAEDSQKVRRLKKWLEANGKLD